MQEGKIEITVGIFVLLALCVFIYMGFQIGAFRFDRGKYSEYTIYFKDISGLSRKADVKIAGVKVGWVESIKLHANGDLEPEVKAMVLKEYSIYSDSYALVRQQGLLGPNYLEIIPGDPLMRKIRSGESLGKPSKTPVSIDEILAQFKQIATNVEQVSETFKDALGGPQGSDQIRSIFENINHTTQRLASFSEVLERSFTKNEDNIADILSIGKDIRKLTERLETDIFPSFKEGFDRIASKLEATGTALEEASLQARDGLKSITSVAEKVNEGKGLLGKLINEDETYKDLKVAVSGLRNYFAKAERMQIIFDSHSEYMRRQAENYTFEDSKGFFDVRIHPTQDYFYLLQLAASEKGYVDRHEIIKQYADTLNNPVDVNTMILTDAQKLEHGYRQKLMIYNRNAYKIGIQFGKIFGDIAVRFGLFEGTAGLGCDINIPLLTDKFRWVTSLEVYDWTGQLRRDDRRPHFKWLNRMFFMRNLYVTFGADDFAARHNMSVFVGAGIRFGDDDVKFMLGSLSGVAGGGGGSAPFLTGTSVVGH